MNRYRVAVRWVTEGAYYVNAESGREAMDAVDKFPEYPKEQEPEKLEIMWAEKIKEFQ